MLQQLFSGTRLHELIGLSDVENSVKPWVRDVYLSCLKRKSYGEFRTTVYSREKLRSEWSSTVLAGPGYAYYIDTKYRFFRLESIIWLHRMSYTDCRTNQCFGTNSIFLLVMKIRFKFPWQSFHFFTNAMTWNQESIFIKLGWLGILNRTVNDSDSDDDEFGWWLPSDLDS